MQQALILDLLWFQPCRSVLAVPSMGSCQGGMLSLSETLLVGDEQFNKLQVGSLPANSPSAF